MFSAGASLLSAGEFNPLGAFDGALFSGCGIVPLLCGVWVIAFCLRGVGALLGNTTAATGCLFRLVLWCCAFSAILAVLDKRETLLWWRFLGASHVDPVGRGIWLVLSIAYFSGYRAYHGSRYLGARPAGIPQTHRFVCRFTKCSLASSSACCGTACSALRIVCGSEGHSQRIG